MNKVAPVIITSYLSGIWTTVPASDVNQDWVLGTCGEPVSVSFVHNEVASKQSQTINFIDYMEEEESSADGSVSPIW